MPALLFSSIVLAARPDATQAPAFVHAANSESVLARWHDYALASITPQFSWAVLPASHKPPSVLERYGTHADIVTFSDGNSATRVDLSIASGFVSDTPSLLSSRVSSTVGVPQSGVERTVVTPSLVHEWGNGGVARLSAVLAYQRFASLGLGTAQWSDQTLPPTWSGVGNSSYGAGARADFSGLLNDRLRWAVGVQSRVGMDAFSNYRGVFSDPGDFDIPANASLGLSYALTPTFGVDVGVQRVMYSAITPFTSSSLPKRFLTLLGSGASPRFEWRDLTVYSLGWTVHDDDVGNLEVRFTTRQQPSPTSALLEQALAPDTADHMVSLGWSRAFGQNTNLSLAASYASSPYLLLMPTYRSTDSADASRLEFDALWSVHF